MRALFLLSWPPPVDLSRSGIPFFPDSLSNHPMGEVVKDPILSPRIPVIFFAPFTLLGGRSLPIFVGSERSPEVAVLFFGLPSIFGVTIPQIIRGCWGGVQISFLNPPPSTESLCLRFFPFSSDKIQVQVQTTSPSLMRLYGSLALEEVFVGIHSPGSLFLKAVFLFNSFFFFSLFYYSFFFFFSLAFFSD